ncbi:MAG: hypothetical protein R2873_27440 [Caldilineaceae bacterium]
MAGACAGLSRGRATTASGCAKGAWDRIGHLYPTCNGETVIAWIRARTVKSPNPAVNVNVPLVRSFELSKNMGKRTWIEPKVDPNTR